MYNVHVYDKRNSSRIFMIGYLNIEIIIIIITELLLAFVNGLVKTKLSKLYIYISHNQP